LIDDENGSAQMQLALAVSGTEEGLGWDEANEILENCFGSKATPSFDRIVGFIDGAASVWSKVSRKGVIRNEPRSRIHRVSRGRPCGR
jgi:hypothetical protein